MKYHNALWIIPIAMLIVAIFIPMPYYFYQILRWILCITSIFLSFLLWESIKLSVYAFENRWYLRAFISFIIIAILYNPISPIHLTRDIWIVLNILTLFIYLAHWIVGIYTDAAIYKAREKNKYVK